jgi:hypothetical protein
MILGSTDDAHRLASVAWAPNVAEMAGACWPVLIDSLLSSDPHVVLIKSGTLPCAPRPSRSDSHSLESATLFILCLMKFARKGIHPADQYWKAAKRMLLFMSAAVQRRGSLREQISVSLLLKNL